MTYSLFLFQNPKRDTRKLLEKIDALKENQCTTHWLLNGFFSREMFNLLFWLRNVFYAETLDRFSLQFKLTKFRLLIFVRKIHILANK